MTDPIERLEYFATNDTAHGGDCETPADCDEWKCENCGATLCYYENCHSCGPFCHECAKLALEDVFAYLRAVKRFGLALQQLGRRCDE